MDYYINDSVYSYSEFEVLAKKKRKNLFSIRNYEIIENVTLMNPIPNPHKMRWDGMRWSQNNVTSTIVK